ncbi:hypothetical protein [Ornithinibacillus halotolerans]|uniref:hypothetical protein n=1 Tax=Ornithinibacillus halotolerans TaxID=1274357 RepID=UPI00166F3079|nr:hypothetical protein [Ornithinibacillus halotolerans]
MICFLRERKDATSDCLRAMEAIMKHLTNRADIDNTDIVKRKNQKHNCNKFYFILEYLVFFLEIIYSPC